VCTLGAPYPYAATHYEKRLITDVRFSRGPNDSEHRCRID
jgi:hypothetical protein